jgi:hypothetical protein
MALFESSVRSRSASTQRVTPCLVCHEDGVFAREARMKDWRTHPSFKADVAKVAAARMEGSPKVTDGGDKRTERIERKETHWIRY